MPDTTWIQLVESISGRLKSANKERQNADDMETHPKSRVTVAHRRYQCPQ